MAIEERAEQARHLQSVHGVVKQHKAETDALMRDFGQVGPEHPWAIRPRKQARQVWGVPFAFRVCMKPSARQPGASIASRPVFAAEPLDQEFHRRPHGRKLPAPVRHHQRGGHGACVPLRQYVHKFRG